MGSKLMGANQSKPMRKRFEILLLQLIVKIARGRNVARAPYISRRDNNKLWAIYEQVEGIVGRMQDDYVAARTHEAQLELETESLLHPNQLTRISFTAQQYNDAWARVVAARPTLPSIMNAEQARQYVVAASYGKPIPDALSYYSQKRFEQALINKDRKMILRYGEAAEVDLVADEVFLDYHGFRIEHEHNYLIVTW